MFFSVFKFELYRQLRSPGAWVMCVALVCYTLASLTSGYWDDLLGSGRVARNSPFAIYYVSMFAGVWAATLGAVVMTGPIMRDLDTNFASVLYATPIRRFSLFAGKYLASILTLTLIMCSVIVGALLLPVLNNVFGLGLTTMTPPWAHMAHAFTQWLLPSIFLFGTLHFCLTALTGRLSPSYAIAVLFIVFYVASVVVASSPISDLAIVQILDPIGQTTLESQISFWSADDRGQRFIETTGVVAINRAIFLLIGASVLIWTVLRFDPRTLLKRAQAKSTTKRRDDSATASARTVTLHSLPPTTFSAKQLGLALQLGWSDFRILTRDTAFRLIWLTALLFSMVGAGGGAGLQNMEETAVPAIAFALRMAEMSMVIPLYLAMVFFSGEMAGRERSSGLSAIVDATPLRNDALIIAKTVGMSLLAITLGLTPALALFILQLAQGYVEQSPLLYAYSVFVVMAPYLFFFGAATLIIQALTGQKALAQALGVFLGVLVWTLDDSGAIENSMLVFGVPVDRSYSDFGLPVQFWLRHVSFYVYWGALCVGLLAISVALWPRGTQVRIIDRLRSAPRRFTPGALVAAMAGFAGFAFSGAFIHHNTFELANFQTRTERNMESAEFERIFGDLLDKRQPIIEHVDLAIALNPMERSFDVEGAFRIVNPHAASVSEIALQIPEFSTVSEVRLGDRTLVPLERDDALRMRLYRIEPALDPGESDALHFNQQTIYTGFSDDEMHGRIDAAGAVLTADELPQIRYDRSRELTLAADRARFDLPPHRPAADATDSYRVQQVALGDLVTYTIRVEAPAGYVVAGPGAGARQDNSWRFASERPLPWNFLLTAGRYGVAPTTGQAGDGEVLVGHLPAHRTNVPRMIEAVDRAIDTLTPMLGDYPWRQTQILEVPKGFFEEEEDIASSANLVALPEERAWLHNYRTTPPFDYVSYIVGRELASGWVQAVAPAANVRGRDLIIDALPAYLSFQALSTSRPRSELDRYFDFVMRRYQKDSSLEDGVEPSLLETDEESYAADKGFLALVETARLLGPQRMTAAIADFRAGRPTERNRQAAAPDLVNALLRQAQTPEVAARIHELYRTQRPFEQGPV